MRAEVTPPRHPTGINTALLTIIVTVSFLYSNTTLHSITMASGVYPYKPEIINGEVSGENDIFATRIVNFHKLSGYDNLMKGIFLFKIILFCILF